MNVLPGKQQWNHWQPDYPSANLDRNSRRHKLKKLVCKSMDLACLVLY